MPRGGRFLSGALRAALLAAAAIAPAIVSLPAQAALSVVGTRFIYPGGARAETITARNSGSTPLLVQIWLDDGNANADPSGLRVPFVVAPPLARLDPQHALAVRVRAVGDELPSDRESRFWINLLEVPPAGPADNMLRIAYRLRMKLLYRPRGIDGDPRDAPDRLTWTYPDARARPVLVSKNPTPFYVTLTRVVLQGRPVVLAGGAVDVEPFGRAEIPLDAPPGPPADDIVFDAVDDGGRSREHRGRLDAH
ncbi:fimbrial biogenesis chaperone [Burkholderia paludis]|uniref:fimbrial biogenesis chaperone n=1 Tax=Burkholderia paludis TaxID=1506587 RepID=UPI0006913DAB|nr:fimbria/pilus periplasmic chaperone [Burkholderia paludis]